MNSNGVDQNPAAKEQAHRNTEDEEPIFEKKINFDMCKNFELKGDDLLEKALIDLLKFDDEQNCNASMEGAGAVSASQVDSHKQILFCPKCDECLLKEHRRFAYIRVTECTFKCQGCGQDSTRLRYYNERLKMQQDALIVEQKNSVVAVEKDFRQLQVSRDGRGNSR